jgi:thioredoxin-like negative regulator of GroEL
LLDRAQRDCEAALADQPTSVQARLQLATALGMKGRRASLKEAMNAGYARRGRALIDEALKLSPQEPRAHALLGGWNLEVVRRGGAIGSALMGASTRAGMQSFDRARALAPDDPAIAFHYALALLSLDATRYAQKAGALLSAAASAAPRNSFEANVSDQARRLSGVLAGKGPMAAANAVAAYLG